MAFSALALLASASAAPRLDRENLLQFHATPDRVMPVKTTADWQKRRAEILADPLTPRRPSPF